MSASYEYPCPMSTTGERVNSSRAGILAILGLDKSIKLIVEKLLFFLISTKDMKVNQNTFNLLLNEDHTKFFKHIKKI